jgi:hypothetical protein
MMKGMGQLRTVIPKVLGFFEEARGIYAMRQAAGDEASAEIISHLLLEKMDGWSPTVNGVAVLDDGTRGAGARFIAGLVVGLESATLHAQEAS